MEQSDLSTLSLYLYPSLFRRGSFVDVIVLSDFIDWAPRFRRIGFGIGFSNNFVVLFVSLLWMDIYSRRSGRRIFFLFFFWRKRRISSFFLGEGFVTSLDLGFQSERGKLGQSSRGSEDLLIRRWTLFRVSSLEGGRIVADWSIERWRLNERVEIRIFSINFSFSNYELLERNINRNTFERIIV